MPWIRGSLWSIEGSVAARSTYRNTVGHSATAAGRVTSILTVCSPTISMAGSGGAATRRTYRDTVGYSAIVAGRMGDLDPDRLYSDQNHGRFGRRCDTQYLQRYHWAFSDRCWAGGYVLTLPSVRLLLRTGYRAAALPGVACPAGARLFWKSRGKSTRGLRPSGLRGLVESPPVVAQHAPCGRLLLPPATVFVFGC